MEDLALGKADTKAESSFHQDPVFFLNSETQTMVLAPEALPLVRAPLLDLVELSWYLISGDLGVSEGFVQLLSN